MPDPSQPKRSVWCAVIAVFAILAVYAGGYFVVLGGRPDTFTASGSRRSVYWLGRRHHGIWRLYVPVVWLEAKLRGHQVDVCLLTDEGPHYAGYTKVYGAQP